MRAHLSLYLFIALCTLVATIVLAQSNCPPGTYIYNASGSYICLPEVKIVESPVFVFSAYLNDSGLYVVGTCVDPSGCNVFLEVRDPGNGEVIVSNSTSLSSGETAMWVVPISGYDYVIINLTVNNVNVGLYAVPKPFAPKIDISSLEPRTALIATLAIVAPILGVVLRGNPREGGLALIAISFLYLPLMHALGLSYPIPEIITGISFVAGVAMVATTRG